MLVPSIIDLATNQKLQDELKMNIGKLGVTNADQLIAKEILDNIK
jgi:hypothetical protein